MAPLQENSVPLMTHKMLSMSTKMTHEKGVIGTYLATLKNVYSVVCLILIMSVI